jgi:hypothetical protein
VVGLVQRNPNLLSVEIAIGIGDEGHDIDPDFDSDLDEDTNGPQPSISADLLTVSVNASIGSWPAPLVCDVFLSSIATRAGPGRSPARLLARALARPQSCRIGKFPAAGHQTRRQHSLQR